MNIELVRVKLDNFDICEDLQAGLAELDNKINDVLSYHPEPQISLDGTGTPVRGSIGDIRDYWILGGPRAIQNFRDDLKRRGFTLVAPTDPFG